MSVYVTNAVMDHFKGKGSLLILAFALASFANTDGTSIFPSVGTLAQKARLSKRMVQILLKELIRSGWLIRVSAGSGGRRGEFCKMDGYRGNTTLYRINPSWIAEHVNLKRLSNSERTPALTLVKGATSTSLGRNVKQDSVQQLLHTTNQSTDQEYSVVVDNHIARGKKVNSSKFAMHQDWRPCDDFENRLGKLGVPRSILTQVRLAEFVHYWESREDIKFNQQRWEHKLLQHLHRIHIRIELRHGGGEDFYADMPESLSSTFNL